MIFFFKFILLGRCTVGWAGVFQSTEPVRKVFLYFHEDRNHYFLSTRSRLGRCSRELCVIHLIASSGVYAIYT